MKRLAIISLLAAVPLALSGTGLAAQGAAAATAGKLIYSGDGKLLGPINRVTEDGNVQVILDGKLVTIPATTVSDAGGKVTTSLSKSDLRRR
jgi:hypothetical protein